MISLSVLMEDRLVTDSDTDTGWWYCKLLLLRF